MRTKINFEKEIEKAKKNPKFIAELNRFIKITSGVYRLKDHKIL